MKKLLLLLSFIFLTGCFDHNVGVVGNKRIMISGNVLTTENIPLEKISMTASGSEYFILNIRSREILGEGFTNASGEFSFVSLDTGNSFYGISINHPNHEDYREEYASIHFLDSIGSRENSFELVNIKLPKTQEFELKVNNSSGSNDTLYYKLTYPNPEEYRKLNENSFAEIPYNFQSEIESGSRLLPDENERTILFRTLQNSTIQFAYKLRADVVYDTINVEITPENLVYEFNY